MLSFREATLEDASICEEIIDLQEKSFDPAAHSVGLVHVREILNGYFSEVHSELLIEDDIPVAFINIHGDDVRKTYFPDIYVRPSHDVFNVALTRLEEYISKKNAQWTILIGINARDDYAKKVLSQCNYQWIRKYWGMEAPLNDVLFPALPTGLEVKVVDIERNLHEWYQVHQDSFSEHFGFQPRPFEKWRDLFLSAEGFDPDGTFLLYENGECVGFVESSNEKAHENSGYINMVGVRKSKQGMRYGTLLIQWAMAYAKRRNFSKIGLNVDTGNTTSALNVYQRLGFREISSWEQFKKIL